MSELSLEITEKAQQKLQKMGKEFTVALSRIGGG